ncbi:hypothetical protein X975_15672, partial [Stegodyphus mimosarum]
MVKCITHFLLSFCMPLWCNCSTLCACSRSPRFETRQGHCSFFMSSSMFQKNLMATTFLFLFV